ncbi:MAG: serine/threonine protein kinase [Armatimonadetes bacterium]|nr:serine/threonine protein kinase [Armatimonadota bacterium]
MQVQIPSRIGHYEVLRLLGKSNDIVYEGYDPRMDRRVAIKIMEGLDRLSPSQVDYRVRRFLREAKVVAAVCHPNVMQIYDMGLELGVPYLVMELVEGASLASTISQKGTFTVPEASQILVPLLEGLAAAHERGIVHRDLKPANIQVLPNGSAKLLDFGVASMVGASALTEANMTLGTPCYMSPEQHDGKADRRSDLYSLTVITYEMLSGSLPFKGSTQWEILAQIVHNNPDIPTHLPAAVQDFLRKGLARDPCERFQDAEEMLLTLQSLAKSGPQSHKPLPVAAPARHVNLVHSPNAIILPTSNLVPDLLHNVIPWIGRWKECLIFFLLALLIPFLRLPFVLISAGFAVYEWFRSGNKIAIGSYVVPATAMLLLWFGSNAVQTPSQQISAQGAETRSNNAETSHQVSSSLNRDPGDLDPDHSVTTRQVRQTEIQEARAGMIPTPTEGHEKEATSKKVAPSHTNSAQHGAAERKATAGHRSSPKPSPNSPNSATPNSSPKQPENPHSGRHSGTRLGEGSSEPTDSDPDVDPSAGRRGGSRLGGT